MVEQIKNLFNFQEFSQEKIKNFFKLAEEKRKKDEEFKKESLDKQLAEIQRDKRIPDLALAEIANVIEGMRRKYQDIIKKNSEIAQKYQANTEMIKEQNQFLEQEFEGLLKEFGLHYLDTAELLYTDEKFNIANYNFFRSELSKVIDKIFANDHKNSLEEIDQAAMIFFDIDGLKMVNDFSLDKHAAGDKLLALASDILTSGRTKKWLENQGLRVISTHRSGDEFMLLIFGNQAVSLPTTFVGIDGATIEDKSIIEYALEQIKKEFNQDGRFQEILDFSNPKQRKVFEQKHVIKKDEWPPNFKFQGSVSGGSASFLEVISMLSLELDNPQDLSYQDLLKKIKAKMINLSDNRMIADKERNKIDRAKGDLVQQTLNKILLISGR